MHWRTGHPADPTYEIDESWDIHSGLLLLLSCSSWRQRLVWWAVFARASSVEYILSALGDIERGHLGARLPGFDLAEMSRISVGFNHMQRRSSAAWPTTTR